jgi:ergothioneine biosynthesis protein EgtB
MNLSEPLSQPPSQPPSQQLWQPLWQRYAAVRAQTLALAAPLSEADAQVQSMPDASPAKWHLAHLTWFFETFVLEAFERGFKPYHPAFRTLFNSYYQGVGEQHPRPQRGLVTRPSLAEVKAYRAAVDERMQSLLRQPLPAAAHALVVLGLNHEQQHQELMLTDVLHLFSCNPLLPNYLPTLPLPNAAAADAADAADTPLCWLPYEGGLVQIGHASVADAQAADGFAFDNESPRHTQFLRPFTLAQRLTTRAEWLQFIDDGGYKDPRWWLAAGWDWRCAEGIDAPAYWHRAADGAWQVFTLRGLQAVSGAQTQGQAPVCHISHYEADAFTQWASAQHGLPLRLPTEAEWEHAAVAAGPHALQQGHFADSGLLHPRPASRAPGLQQMFGDVWEWTRSSYLPYPGFRPWAGAVGEYNGKFMVNQTVLRGGSCATPHGHMRASYRNFFPSHARWQFSGLRLAHD